MAQDHPDATPSDVKALEQCLLELDDEWTREQASFKYSEPTFGRRPETVTPIPSTPEPGLPSLWRIVWGGVSLLVAYGFGLAGLAFFTRQGEGLHPLELALVVAYLLVVTLMFGYHIIKACWYYIHYRVAMKRYQLRRSEILRKIDSLT